MKLHMMFLILTACSASVDGGGDDEGVGNDDIRFRLTTVADEREDTIDFSTGEPVHDHGGTRSTLGGPDCPDVYKHLYLMDAAPAFGRETAPNGLVFQIDAKDSAEYRVRAGEATLRDWTAVAGDTIELARADVASGKHLVDVRVGESIATTCFLLHPLAAPLETSALAPAPMGLAGMTFAAASQISRLLGDEYVTVYSQTFAHHTAEPIELVIETTAPATTYDRRAVDEHVALPVISLTTVCNNADGDLGEPICDDTSAIPASSAETAGGPLTTGIWGLRVVDEATNMQTPNCTVTNLRATCHLPARTGTGASQRYRVELSIANIPQLAPFGDPSVTEHTLLGQSFTGRILDTKKRCAQFQEVTKFGVTVRSCIKEAHHVRIQAMDTAKLELAATAFTFATAPDATTPPNTRAFDAPPFTWDAGDADLPGPQ